jgi:hypothetical protein
LQEIDNNPEVLFYALDEKLNNVWCYRINGLKRQVLKNPGVLLLGKLQQKKGRNFWLQPFM